MGKFNMGLCETHLPAREAHSIGADTQEILVTATACPALHALGLRIVGVSDARSGFRFVRHHPREGQVLATVTGRGRVWAENDWHWCEPGQVYVTPAQVPHGYQATSETPWRLCWAMYSLPTAEMHTLTEPCLYDAQGVPLLHAIEGLAAEVGSGADETFVERWAHLIDSCARRLLRQNASAPDDAARLRLRMVWDAVERDLARPWDNRELARRAGLSVEHLRRLSQLQVGHSPMRHVTYLRMRYASTLLGTGTYTIGAVASQVGYDNPFAFSVAFKREFGMSPSVWRSPAKK